MLRVNNVGKKYANFELKDVSFNVKKGHIVGFVGINGSGKTTTIKLLLNLIKREQGEILFFDEMLNDKTESKIKEQIGVVFDEGFFYDCLTMNQMKNIISSAYSNWDENAYKQYMTRFELNGKQKIESLSKGMKMKYALALALSHNAKILIMDEPAAGLDPLVRSQLNDILLEYVKDGGKSVFFSTHITSDLDKIADDIIFINDGKIVMESSKKEMREKFTKNGEILTIEEIMVNYIKEVN